MPGECWKKVQYIRTGCFQNRQNAPSTGIFYQLKTCINNARFKVRWIWNTAKLRCHLPSALEHTEWETVSFTMFCALTNIQVSNSLCLDGPSLGRNSFDFHLLVISHFVCSTTFILRLMDKIFAYLLTTLTFKVVTLSDHQTFIIIC